MRYDSFRTRRPVVQLLEPRMLLAGLVNGGFDWSVPDSPDFGWDIVGPVVVDGDRASMNEDAVRASSLQQAFSVPAGASELQFELHSLDLHRSTNQPPDAIEVALLDATTLEPLVGTLAGVPNADSLVSFDADGRVYFGADTTIPGAPVSGELTSLTLPLTVSVDISGITANTQVLLVFELLGFGEVDSSVALDNVELSGDLPPQITVSLDPASDTGVQGDQYTQSDTVTLIGQGPVGQFIELDIDGDGFDDGGATVNASGEYRLVGLALPSETTFQVRASNTFGETVLARTLIPDSLAPQPTISAPAVDELLTSDPGFFEVNWDDHGGSGIDDAMIGVDDITIDGVDVDRIERLTGDRVRYWYSDDGDVLPYGPINARIAPGATQDVAGNQSIEVTQRINSLDPTCAWHNGVLPPDTNADGLVTPLDALLVINELNRRSAAQQDSSLPQSPPSTGDFVWLDVKCDRHIVPLDALIVINFLNNQE